MISDIALLDLAAALYQTKDKGFWAELIEDPNCYCAISRVPTEDGLASVLVFRGSTTMLDWWNDLDETPLADPQLGMVHLGFYHGLRVQYDRLVSLLPTSAPLYVVGHSLGAARAMLMAGLLIANGRTPAAVVGWGCPRPGGAQLAQLVARCQQARWYRNRVDQVTYVPWRLGAYKHAGEMRRVDAAPLPGDSWGPLADHHLELYRQGLMAAEQVAS